MKTNKSPESETTPSKKKLKQARLPFKLISEGSPTPITPQPRKRKLSATEAESVSKVGKISKENDLVESLVIISDEESKDGDKSQKEDKSHNPLVKLVDTAWKKKLQKAKGSKKRKNSRKTKGNGPSKPCIDGKDSEDCEMMEVDNETEAAIETEPSMLEPVCDIVVLEDSNNSSDIMDKNKPKNAVNKTNDKHESEEVEKTETKIDKSIIEESPTKSNSIDTEEPPTKNTESPKKTDLSGDTQDESKTGSDLTELKKDKSIDNTPTETQNKIENETPDKAKDTEETTVVTPKRSARNKSKVEQNNNSKGSPSSSKLNDSICSTPTTPKQTRSSSITNNQDESMNESTSSAKLTPKQVQKKLESAKKKEEKEKERIEREMKRQQEKEERAKQRQEKEDQKKKEREEKEEAKKRERDEKEEQRKKEKEEKDRQKELEKKQREEKEEQKKKEKEEKEEQKKKEKEAREEEKRKKQEALELEKQEQELKKKKAAEAFVNFFVPKQKSEKDQATIGPVSKNSMLSSFTIKVDMRLAPTVRVDLSEEKREQLDDLLDKQDASESKLYLKSIREGKSMPMSSGKTWPTTDKDDDDDVMIVEDDLPPAVEGDGEIISCDPAPREKLRPKLFSFHANRRPPYWGTWRKKSSFVKPRRPFGQDEKQLDYEVDSDEEWEEEQEGESLDGSAAGSDDEQDADEYEVDNEVFVPHGYLSDEEATMDEDDVLSLSPDAQKARLKVLEDEFEFEMKKPTEKLKPRMYGLLWENSECAKPEKCVDAIWNYFGKLSMIMNDPTPLLQPSNEPEEAEKKKVKKKKIANDGEPNSPKNEKKRKSKPTKSDEKEIKPKADSKKNTTEIKKNQPGINMFLTKLKST